MEELDGISAVNRLLNHSFPVPPSLGPRYFYWSAASLHTREWSSNHSRLETTKKEEWPQDGRLQLFPPRLPMCLDTKGSHRLHRIRRFGLDSHTFGQASGFRIPAQLGFSPKVASLSAWFCSPSQTPVGLPMIKFLGKVYVGKPCCCHTVPVCNLGLRHHGI